MEYVYHVVTERPMTLGQVITFGENSHNGVYNRVMTFKAIIDGEQPTGELAELISSDMDKWSKVAYRELSLEKVRRELYPQYPSRMACLYTSRTIEEARTWAEFFSRIGRKVYSIVKLQVDGSIFDGDACNCFDGTEDEQTNLNKALKYWKNDSQNDKPVIETLVNGTITVSEMYDWKQEK